MNIQSISIVPTVQGCNADCKYCISAMTKAPKGVFSRLDFNKLTDSLLYAKSGGCQTAILTSKGETLFDLELKENDYEFWYYLSSILEDCKNIGKIGQRDLHTNGKLIIGAENQFYELLVQPHYGLTNITVTVASLNKEVNKELMGIDIDYAQLFDYLKSIGLTVRLSCVLNTFGVHDSSTIMEYIKKAADLGVDSVVFREMWIPKNHRSGKVVEWAYAHFVKLAVAQNLFAMLEKEIKIANVILRLPWGELVYDVGGLQVTSATCTVNKYKEGFKSVIHLPDGHLYSGWDSIATKIM